MKRLAAMLLVAATACPASDPTPVASPRALPFSVVRAGAAQSCIDAPDFALVRSEEDWIDVFDRETDCTGGSDVTLPTVELEQAVVAAAWWRAARCAQEAVTVLGVRLTGEEIEVTARSEALPDRCDKGDEVLETFVQINERSAVESARSLVFTLDGQRAGAHRIG